MRFYTETRTTGWNSERCQAAIPDHRCDNGGRRRVNGGRMCRLHWRLFKRDPVVEWV